MRDRDAALDQAIHQAASILADALVRLLFPESAQTPVDFRERESAHVTGG